MKFDFHTHHNRCGHARGTIKDYIDQAISYGVDMIGIADHSPYFADESDHPRPDVAMARSEFPNYVAEVLQLKKQYQGKIEVLLGIESDFIPEHLETYRKAYEPYPFDYIIGSVHRFNRRSIFDAKRWNNLTKQEAIAEKDTYYHLIGQSARSGLFDIIGHMDAMKATYPDFSKIQTEAIDHTLQVIAACDIAIEVNTSGKTKKCGGWYPSDEILERAFYYGVHCTLGSDAHDPYRVYDEGERVREKLKQIGYSQWAIFRQRKRILVDL